MLPTLFLERMKGMLGEEYEAFMASYDQERYQAFRVNTLKADRDKLMEQIACGRISLHTEPVPWAENGFYYEREDDPAPHPYGIHRRISWQREPRS